MKKQFIYMLLLLFVGFVLSCSKDDGVSDDILDDDVDLGNTTYSITFSATIEGVESAETKVSAELFEEGDVIVVSNGEQSKSYEYSTKFSSDDPFEIDRTQNITYTALYPADTAAFAQSSYTFALSADQSTEEGLESSDMLVGVSVATNSISPALTFRHVMSSVVVVVNSDSFSATSSGELTLTAAAEATCDFVEGSYTATTTAAKEIKAYGAGDDVYVAVLAPGDISSIAASYSDTAGGVSGVTTSLDGFTTLESGVQYTFEWDIETNSVTLTGVNITSWEYLDKQDIVTASDNLPTPTLSAIPGSCRAQIEYSLITNDSRISDVIITVDGEEESYSASLFSFDESDYKYKYIIESGSKLNQEGTYDVTLRVESDALSSRESNSVAVQVYDLAPYQSSMRSSYYDYVDSDGATIMWYYTDQSDDDATFTLRYTPTGGSATTVTIPASETKTSLATAAANGSYTLTTTYNIAGMPSEYLDAAEYVETLYFSASMGDKFAKDGTVYDNPFDGEGNRLKGDYPTYSDAGDGPKNSTTGLDNVYTSFGSILHAWDGVTSYTNSSTSADGYHAYGNDFDSVDGAVTFDLQANYTLTQFAFWQRRSSHLYANNNIKRFTIYGAADFAGTLTSTTSGYNDVTADGTPDFDAMPLWIPIFSDVEHTRVGTTTAAALAESTDPDDMQDYQEVINGHHFVADVDKTTTAVRYIRIQFHEVWAGTSNPSPVFSEFDFWGTKQ